eukprot:6222382-Ditylum_brightwellii.AAC.1
MFIGIPDKSHIVNYFKHNGHPFEALDETARWEQYEPCFTFKTAKYPKVIFLCQINGYKPGGMALREDLVNTRYGGIQCFLSGPDLLIPSHVIMLYKNYLQNVKK